MAISPAQPCGKAFEGDPFDEAGLCRWPGLLPLGELRDCRGLVAFRPFRYL